MWVPPGSTLYMVLVLFPGHSSLIPVFLPARWEVGKKVSYKQPSREQRARKAELDGRVWMSPLLKGPHQLRVLKARMLKWFAIPISTGPHFVRTNAGKDWGQEEKGTTEDEMVE